VLLTNQALKRIANKSAHKRPGRSAAAAAQRPVVSCRQDILTELLDPFDMLSRDPVDEAGEPGIPLYVCGDPDASIR
jgi:hypothetical protein